VCSIFGRGGGHFVKPSCCRPSLQDGRSVRSHAPWHASATSTEYLETGVSMVRRLFVALLGAVLLLSPIAASAKHATPPPSLVLYATETQAIHGCRGDEVVWLNTRTGFIKSAACGGMDTRSRVHTCAVPRRTPPATATRTTGSKSRVSRSFYYEEHDLILIIRTGTPTSPGVTISENDNFAEPFLPNVGDTIISDTGQHAIVAARAFSFNLNNSGQQSVELSIASP
jgi:hypothetical protein